MNAPLCRVREILAVGLCLSLLSPGLSRAGGAQKRPGPGPGSVKPIRIAAQALRPAFSAVGPHAVAGHPILETLMELQKMGVPLDRTLTRADAARLLEAAQAVEHGGLRRGLFHMAQELSSAGPAGSSGQAQQLTQAFDSAQAAADAASAFEAPAPSGFWAALSGMPLLPSGLRRRFSDTAEKLRPKLKPNDPASMEVPVALLRREFTLEEIPHETTSQIPLAEKRIVGQDRAMRAAYVALNMAGPRDNLIIAGPEQSGRESGILHLLLGPQGLAAKMPTPPDLVSVTNFENPRKPLVLRLSPGNGPKLKAAVAGFVRAFQSRLPGALQSRELKARKREKTQGHESEMNAKSHRLAEGVAAKRLGKAGKFGLALAMIKTHQGIESDVLITFVADGKLVALQSGEAEALIAAGKFTAEEFEEAVSQWSEQKPEILDTLAEVMGEARQAGALFEEESEALDRQAAADLAEELSSELFAALSASGGAAPSSPAEEEALRYAKSILSQAALRYRDFLPGAEGGRPKSDPLEFFQVAILASNGGRQGAPVVVPKSLAYEPVFGSAERQVVRLPGGSLVKADGPGGPILSAGDPESSLIAANGGFWVAHVMELMSKPAVWPALLEALRTGQVEITEEGIAGALTLDSKRYPVPIKVKVVLIASPLVRMVMAGADEVVTSFTHFAEFEPTLSLAPGRIKETLSGVFQFLKSQLALGNSEVMDMARDAIAASVEFLMREAGSNQEMSAQLGKLKSVWRQATFFAREDPKQPTDIQRYHFDAALEHMGQADAVAQGEMREELISRTVVVETKGWAKNQINGAAVMGSGMGVPLRVTMVESQRVSEVLPPSFSNDREARVTAESFDKALFNSDGYFEHVYGRDFIPLMHRFSFEQSSARKDGDSATVDKIVLRELVMAELPIRQDGALTGSADQLGNVQAVGRINEKIEGWFDHCLSQPGGLTGTQFFVIPRANVAHLMLRLDVVQAVREGKFRVYAVSHVSEIAEIFSGVAYPEVRRLNKRKLEAERLRLANKRLPSP